MAYEFITQAQRDALIELYIGYFNRAAEPAGLNYWAGELLDGLNAGQTEEEVLTDIANQFYDAGVQFGIYSEAQTVESFISTAYANALGRTSVDAAGMAYWTAKLESGEVSRGEFVQQLIHDAKEFAGDPEWGWVAVYLENRVAVGNYFADNSDTSLTDEDAIAAGKEVLSVVTPETAQAGQTAEEAVQAAEEQMNPPAPDTYTLTSGLDMATANVFNSQPDYTPGGNDLVNTLQDEDNLTGRGENPTLNVTLGSVNDAAESLVTPVLTGIETVNVQVTGGDTDPAGISFQDANGVQALNVTRITANNQWVEFIDLKSETSDLSISNATRDGEVYFNYAEGQLEGAADEVTLTLNSVTQDLVEIDQGSWNWNNDESEDEGYGIETLNLVVNGNTNLDALVVSANAEEDRANGTDQSINITANDALEVNQLVANGAENIAIVANDSVTITLNERTNEDDNDNLGLDAMAGEDYDGKAIQTDELQSLTITGAGKVTLNGVTGDDETGVVIDGSTMTGTLAIAVDNDVAGNLYSSLESGSGADEVITYTDTWMDITTNAGADHLHVKADQYDGSGDYLLTMDSGSDMHGQVSTGAGADRIVIEGSIYGNMDTGSTEDGAADGDSVQAVDLDGANLLTGAGDDVVTLSGGVYDGVAQVIDMADGDDHLTVNYGLSGAYAVNTGAGNDHVSFGADADGTITTETGNDTVSIGGDADGAIDLGTGADTLTIDGDLSAAVTAGSDEETGNADGQDTVTVGDNMLGTASITTQAGDDTVFVGGDLETSNDDDVNSSGLTTEERGANKVDGDPDIDTTVAASIDTGDGNDTVTAGNLVSAGQWNDNVIEGDLNADDTITIVGASITTGNGDDTVTLGDPSSYFTPVMAEQTLLDTGAGADTVTVRHDGGVVLAADNDAFNWDYTNREGAVVGEQDTLGAKIDLGADDDSITFTDVAEDLGTGGGWNWETTLVDRGAEVDGGAGTDTLTVNTVDRIDVVTSETYHEVWNGVEWVAVRGGVNAADAADGQGGYIMGVETINLVAENSLSPATLANGADGINNINGSDNNDVIGGPATDDADITGYIRLDVAQVDSDLAVLNLTSNEQRQLLDYTGSTFDPSNADNEDPNATPAFDNGYIAGQTTEFIVENFRGDVTLNLAAYEASGVTDTHTGDTNANGTGDTGENIGEGYDLRDDCETDVTVTVNMDTQVANNTAFTLNLNSNAALANQTGEEDYDVKLISSDTFPDTLLRQETSSAMDITLNVNTGASHIIDLSETFTGGADVDLLKGNTSLTVNGTTAGEQIGLEMVAADIIDVNGAADAFIGVRESNAYTIMTDEGNDVIHMENDLVDIADSIDAGAGDDWLVIAGGNDIGVDVWDNINNVENLNISFEEGVDAASSIVVNSNDLDAVLITNVPQGEDEDGIDDTSDPSIGTHTVNLAIGDEDINSTVDNDLIINANVDTSAYLEPVACNDLGNNIHSDQLFLNVASSETNLDVFVNTAEGTAVDFAVNEAERVSVHATVSGLDYTYVADDVTGNGYDFGYTIANDPVEGDLQLTVAAGGAIDEIILIDNVVDKEGNQIGVDGEFGANGQNVVVEVSDSWATSELLIDASDIDDAGDASELDPYAGVGLVGNFAGDFAGRFNGATETDAMLTIKGTQNNDVITGGWMDDTLEGNAGSDLIMGGLGNDTIDGGAGDDVIYGNRGADQLTGGAGDDTFVLGDSSVAQFAVDESNGNLSGTAVDTITDFQTQYTDVTGVHGDTIRLDLGLVGGVGNDFVDLSSFALVDNTADGDDELAGTTTDRVIGDSYYSSEAGKEKFVFDVDGNGDVTTSDITIMSPNVIKAADLDIQLDTGEGNDMIRLGQGVDRVSGGANDDTFVIVGSIDALERATYAADIASDFIMDTITAYSLDNVVDENQLLNLRSQTEANLGDVLDGGTDDGSLYADTLHVYGNTDLTVTTITGIETLVVHSNITLTLDQLNSFDTIVLDQFTSHTINVVDAGGLLLDSWSYAGTIEATGEDAVTIDRSLAGSSQLVVGYDGDDTLTGSAFADAIYGNGGADTINGGAGNDTIYGGAGADTMDGGAGADTFVYAQGDSTEASMDVINGFNVAEDVIDLSGVAPGTSHSPWTITDVGSAADYAALVILVQDEMDWDNFPVVGTVGTDTYVFVDHDHNDSFDATDTVIKLAGVAVNTLTDANLLTPNEVV